MTAAPASLDYRNVSFAYPATDERVVDGIDLDVRPGELLVVSGPSGSGKSTLLRAANGLVPHATGGRFSGDVIAGGRSTRTSRPRDLADVVGFVHQDPEAQFVVDQVEADLAFALENLGYDAATMRRRVEEVLDALDIAALRGRDPATLSGGERQRCAIAGAMVAMPSVLVLDEPTSQLDPQGAEDVLAAVARLNADVGTTILIAEHRLDRAAPLADRAALLDAGRIVAIGDPGRTLASYAGAPAVTRLGLLLGWDPPPLTVKDARTRTVPPTLLGALRPVYRPERAQKRLVAARSVRVSLGGRDVLNGVDVEVCEGEVVALVGRNGAGKTTLLRTLAGLQHVDGGRVETSGDGTRVAYVPQDPNSLLFAPTVRAELEHTLRLLGGGHGHGRRHPDGDTVDRWLDLLGLSALSGRHPRSLSGGERQRVAIAAVAVGGAPVLLLDEPTRGMDAPSREALARAVRGHSAGGGAVVLATHDVELAARVATRVVVLGDGDVVADGDTRAVLAGSLFAPQVFRVVPPFLTVDEVEDAMRR